MGTSDSQAVAVGQDGLGPASHGPSPLRDPAEAAAVPGRALAAGVLARHWKVLAPAAAALSVPLLLRHSPAAVWPALVYLCAVGVLLAAIDVRYRRLPDVLVLGSYPVLAALLLIPAVSRHQGPAWARAVEAGLAVGAAMLLVPGRLIGKGDGKLIGLLVMPAAWHGWAAVLPALFVFFLLPAVASVALLAAGRAKRGDHIPFGPWLLLGAYLYLLLIAKAW